MIHETRLDLPHISRFVATKVVVVQESSVAVAVADAVGVAIIRVTLLQSERPRDSIPDVHSSPSGIFCVPPIDPLLQLDRSPRSSEPRRHCEADDHVLGVVVLAVGCCEPAEDLLLDEGEAHRERPVR